MDKHLMIKHEKVLNLISEEFKLDSGFCKIKNRSKKYVLSKKMACWILYVCSGLKMKEVADIIGYADHSTAQHHIHDYWNMCKSDDAFKKMGDDIYLKSIEIYETD